MRSAGSILHGLSVSDLHRDGRRPPSVFDRLTYPPSGPAVMMAVRRLSVRGRYKTPSGLADIGTAQTSQTDDHTPTDHNINPNSHLQRRSHPPKAATQKGIEGVRAEFHEPSRGFRVVEAGPAECQEKGP